ncbi:MAG: substrate-binding domain-containing protein [Actinobacteria bacterium]|nr:substrate-binding domain-containing protein [Actinomycetota bacterium]
MVVLTIGIGVLAAGCGGGGSSTGSSGGGSGGPEGTGRQGNSAAISAAKKKIAPYVGHPSPFPVAATLPERPTGEKVAYMDCGTPICALIWELLQPAAETMGLQISRIKAGSAADTVASAFDTVVAQEPDAVLVGGVDVELWSKQLKQLQEDEIPVVTTGVTGTEKYGIVAPQAAENLNKVEGDISADYVLAEFGPESNVAFYGVPELTFSKSIEEAFAEELESTCPDCSMRSVEVPVATLGNTAPTRVVSDLQANPETDVAVFATDEIQTGLPQALEAAGIEVKTLGVTPTPTNLQYLKEGKETVGLGVDLPVLVWTMVDQAAREMTGVELQGDEAKGLVDLQFLTQKDITFDPSKGWTGYPDFAERFEKLWGGESLP